jgi:hypothetical protein
VLVERRNLSRVGSHSREFVITGFSLMSRFLVLSYFILNKVRGLNV